METLTITILFVTYQKIVDQLSNMPVLAFQIGLLCLSQRTNIVGIYLELVEIDLFWTYLNSLVLFL